MTLAKIEKIANDQSYTCYNANIIRITDRLINQHMKEKQWTHVNQVKFDLQEIYEMTIYPEYELSLDTSCSLGERAGNKILGKTITKDGTILIDSSISPPNQDPRYPFTLAHEFGHGILHCNNRDCYRCTTKAFGTRGSLIEQQANAFAEHLLMPNELVKAKFIECYGSYDCFRYLGTSNYWFTPFDLSYEYKISTYTDFCSTLGAPLCRFFSNVSKTAMGLKMHKLELVNNLTSEQYCQDGNHIRHIIKTLLFQK